jgi:hypothetical protein
MQEDGAEYQFCTHASTCQKAINCFEFLVGLPDSHYESITIAPCASHCSPRHVMTAPPSLLCCDVLVSVADQFIYLFYHSLYYQVCGI